MSSSVEVADCRAVRRECDVWITDPPYGDYVVYHELSEFFLAWYERRLPELFPGWPADSRRGLAVQGTGCVAFRRGLADCYRNLARHMPEHGIQVILFTHQEPALWADLALTLGEARLRVTAAWCVRTETAVAGIKQGRHVPGTVVLVLRRQAGQTSRDSRIAEVCERLYPQLEDAVRRQVASGEGGDVDRQMAGCTAAVRLLTQQPLAGRAEPTEQQAAVERLIRAAVAIARRG
jgi:adenine-specific DNA methylase